VFEANPEIELVKLPTPEPLIVFVCNTTVGLVDVFQTTPFADMIDPPSELMFPPEVALE
jgi:hypothetical protein